MPLDKTQILSFLRNNTRLFSERYNVRRIGLFGSYARARQRPESDIDILVEGENIGESELRELLEKKFEKKVDIVKENSLYNFMKYIIHKETEYA
ncbi:MAG TPA: nucleotidyltransferase domain-containing protein [Chitinivibrionales bacterium]|jgi:predicted nucleotidyltransferase|nr:nucleotidyltransferase domain-containing protein [Chitinivibrionales bacterium]